MIEDLDWLYQEWWLEQGERMSPGHLRRGSATLRQLVVDGMLQRAWLDYGFTREPAIIAPDLRAWASSEGLDLGLAPGVVAGGGRQDDMDLAFIGGFRVENPDTGTPAGAEAGFAVLTTGVIRDVRSGPATPSPLDDYVETSWPLSAFGASAAAVRSGKVLTVRDVIGYFANYSGGVHIGQVGRQRKNSDRHAAVEDLTAHVRATRRDGLLFELLSIGQAIGRAPDIRALVGVAVNKSAHAPGDVFQSAVGMDGTVHAVMHGRAKQVQATKERDRWVCPECGAWIAECEIGGARPA